MNKPVISLITLLLAVGLTACASIPTAADKTEIQNNDPFESVNRVTFDVNGVLDDILFHPLAEGYRYIFPDEVRDRIASVLNNMKEPVIFANDVLQGEFSKASVTLERFAINTTAGGAGMFDVATVWNAPQQSGDFGQTLYTYGVSSGPYLVLPIIGPSDVRDAVGLGVDAVVTPWSYVAGIGGAQAADEMTISEVSGTVVTKEDENLDLMKNLKHSSLDFYSEIRSVYQQHRNKELGIATKSPNFEDYSNE